MANIHLPNTCSAHLPINHLPHFDVPDPDLLLLSSGWHINVNHLLRTSYVFVRCLYVCN